MIVFLLFFLFGLENCCGIVCVKGEFCVVVDFKLEILLFVKDLVVDFFLFFLFGFENFVIEFFLEDILFEFIDDEDMDEKLLFVCLVLFFLLGLEVIEIIL